MRKLLLCSTLVAAMSPATVMAQVSETAADAKGSWNLFFVYTGAKRAAGADGSYDSLQACRIAAQAMLAEISATIFCSSARTGATLTLER